MDVDPHDNASSMKGNAGACEFVGIINPGLIVLS